jgi:hypothetical protein
MSYAKKDRPFPIKPKAITDAELAKIVAAALRQDFGKSTSAVKRIGQTTSANLRAIRNWYEAKNCPSSGHLLLLARSSPSILKFVLQQIGGTDLWEMFELRQSTDEPRRSAAQGQSSKIYGEKYFTINVSLPPTAAGKLNQRQLWFLGQLQQKRPVKTGDIAAQWHTTTRTAKADVAKLVGMRLIRFEGARKTGRYALFPRR